MRAEYPCLQSSPAWPGSHVQGPLCDLFGWGDAVSGIAQATGNVLAAREQAGAARDAAKISADAATHAADVQGQGAAATLEFERQQAQAEAQQAEIDRRGNYDQWAAHQQGVSTIGELLGLGGKRIPAYVPGITPTFTGAPVSVGAGQTPAAAIARPAVMAPGVPTVGEAVAPGAPAPMFASSMPTDEDLLALRARMRGNGGYVPPVRAISDYVGA